MKVHVQMMEINLFYVQILSLFILLPDKLIIGKNNVYKETYRKNFKYWDMYV